MTEPDRQDSDQREGTASEDETSVLMTEPGRRILEALEVRPALDLIDLASSAHITPTAARRTLDALQAQGIITRQVVGSGPTSGSEGEIALNRGALSRRLQEIASAGI